MFPEPKISDPKTTIIHPLNGDALGDPIAVKPMEFSDKVLRFSHEEPMELGAQFLMWSRSVGRTLTWFLYTVNNCVGGPADTHIITARFTSVMHQDLGKLSA